MSEESVAKRQDFPWFLPLATRWMDNDVYGHVNNVQYYSFFDTAVACHLVEKAGFDPRKAEAIGLVVETRCQYRREISFPETIEIGLQVEKLGNSSAVYRIGIFTAASEEAAAIGRFVHVYVDRMTRRPVRIPETVRDALTALMRAADTQP